NDVRAEAIKQAIEKGAINDAFSGKELAALLYAAKLTTQPGASKQDDVLHLKAVGWEDGEILEINQVTAYFAYANRMVLGLGINTEGDNIGLSPEDSEDNGNWGHQ
ncbi:MAG: alkylhydroperoxidase, partial [Alphaproteobacteria bacterium]